MERFTTLLTVLFEDDVGFTFVTCFTVVGFDEPVLFLQLHPMSLNVFFSLIVTNLVETCKINQLVELAREIIDEAYHT